MVGKIDVEVVQRTEKMYREQTAKLTGELAMAFEEADIEKARLVLHDLQGMNAVLGFEKIAELCEELRAPLKSGKPLVTADLKDAVDRLRSESLALLEEVLK